MRLLKLMRKEYLDFIRDKGFVLALIIEPIILMLVFGYTFSSNIDNLDTIVIDNSGGKYSKEIIYAIDNSNYFNIVNFSGSLDESKDFLFRSEVRSVFLIPDDFDQNIDNAEKGEIYLYLDSSDYTIYNILKGASADVVKNSLNNIVNLIVDDLESERLEKQKKVDDTKNLVKIVNKDSIKNLDDIEALTIEFNETRYLIEDTENKISDTQVLLDDKKDYISDLKNVVSNKNVEILNLISDVEEIQDDLIDIQSYLENLVVLEPTLESEISPLLNNLDEIDSNIDYMVSDLDSLNLGDEIDLEKVNIDEINVSNKYYNIDEFDSRLFNNENEVNRLLRIANNIESNYSQILIKLEGIQINLNKLKKEFLSQPVNLKNEYVYGEISYLDYLAPAIMNMILFFIGIVLTIINIIYEKDKGTFFRVATTPLSKFEFIFSKFVVFLLIGFVEIVYVILIMLLLFDINIVGNIFHVILVLLLLMISSISLGLLLSVVVKSMKQAVILIPVVIIPSILISQTFSPIEVMPKFMQYVAYLSPMFYSNVALREIMIKGFDLGLVMPQILALLLYGIICLCLSVLFFKRRID